MGDLTRAIVDEFYEDPTLWRANRWQASGSCAGKRSRSQKNSEIMPSTLAMRVLIIRLSRS